jgi:hypothetical protein
VPEPGSKARRRTKAPTPPTVSSADRTTDYARAVIAGDIIAGPHVRNACRRHLDDLKRSDGIAFDAAAAAHAFDFFEEVLKLSEGQFEGQPFHLEPSQAFIIGSLFGWKRADGRRRFRRAYIEQGKGNGKSPVAGGIGLFGMTAAGEAGAHGASPHYRVDEESNAPLEHGQLYLVDSGGQYRDGTTDVTRVLPIGTPTPEMRDRFTRVLKGHIALATAVFPHGTNGGQLDGFARRPLWEVGLDYAHGTGHGVGSYLSVHEGPQRIATPNYPGGGPSEPLRAGMIISNEPGYYKAGEYGIRIENLILVEDRVIDGAESPMLGFETLTFCPIERSLIIPALLTEAERAWLDGYHARVLAVLGPQMQGDDLAWLAAKCAPIGPE